MKKMLALLLLPLMLLCTADVRAYADEIPIEIVPFYTYTSSIEASFSINAYGRATCSGMVIPNDSSYSCTVLVRLQRRNDGVWTTIASWPGSGSGYDGAYAEGERNLTSGYTYRVYVTGVVKDSSGNVLETPSKQSAWKTY